MNGRGVRPGPKEMMAMLKGDGGVEELMKQPVYENEYGSFSQAELMADVINILRMDTKQVGATHGVDIEVEKITPEKTAWVLAQMVDGNTEPIVDIFNDIEDQHHDVMEAVMDPEEFGSYLEFKESQLYTTSGSQPIEDVTEDLPEPTEEDADPRSDTEETPDHEQ